MNEKEQLKYMTTAHYLQALGLFTLGNKHTKEANDICDALAEILGTDPNGHVSDAIYGSRDFEELIKLTGWKVAKSGLRNNKSSRSPKSR